MSIVGATGISFTGFTFEHATWLRPGQADGYVEQQTGACAIGNHPENHGCTTATDAFWSVKSPGNVVVANSSKITFSKYLLRRMIGWVCRRPLEQIDCSVIVTFLVFFFQMYLFLGSAFQCDVDVRVQRSGVIVTCLLTHLFQKANASLLGLVGLALTLAGR